MPEQSARRYSSDLTDAQWQLIKPLFQQQTFRDHHPREIVNALFYLNKTGCQWRMLPQGEAGFPPWQTVYYHLRQWMAMGLIEELNDRLRRAARVKEGRQPSPSAAIIDSQSVATGRAGGSRGFDGSKRIKGRKRHIITDTLGFLLAVLVHPANIQDSQQAPHLLKRLLGKVPRLKLIFADQGYSATRPRVLSGAVSAGCGIWFVAMRIRRVSSWKRSGGSSSARSRGLAAIADSRKIMNTCPR